MDRSVLVQVFDQIIKGYDIPTPTVVLKVKAETAALKEENLPYSLLTNLAHAVTWQDFWLQKLAGGRRKSSMVEWKNDFRVPEVKEFAGLRESFKAGLDEARRLAGSDPFDHRLPSDEEAVETLIRIAVHASYHLGQMNLLKRSIGKGKREDDPPA